MNIRLATRDDVPAILDIANWAAMNTTANFAVEPESLQQWLDDFDATHTRFPWVVADDPSSSRALLAFAKASPHRGRCAYHWTAETTVYVHPDHHRRGIGRDLYACLLDILRAQNFRTILAGIAIPNQASERLHASFGFRKVGVFERVGYKFDRWHDVGYWELVLRVPDHPPDPVRPVEEALASLTKV